MNGATATGDGGGIAITFDGAVTGWSRRAKKPATITIGGDTGELELDGRISGSYQLKGEKVTFAVTKSTGSVILRDDTGKEQKRPASQFAGVMGPSGSGTVECTDTGATLETKKQEFTLTR